MDLFAFVTLSLAFRDMVITLCIYVVYVSGCALGTGWILIEADLRCEIYLAA